jgi:5'-nucleotidase
MREGGDGFTMLAEKAFNSNDYGQPLDQVLSDYIKTNSPINIKVEGRITIK